MIHPRLHPVQLILFVATLALVSILGRGASLAQEGAGGATGSKVLGVWQGTTLASCGDLTPPDRCNAQQKVSITVMEGEGSKPSGFYKCSYGTEDCFRQDETGKVEDATITGDRVWIRVMTPDGLSYIFSGRVSGDTVDGGYSCTSGGAVLERGTWRAQRTY